MLKNSLKYHWHARQTNSKRSVAACPRRSGKVKYFSTLRTHKENVQRELRVQVLWLVWSAHRRDSSNSWLQVRNSRHCLPNSPSTRVKFLEGEELAAMLTSTPQWASQPDVLITSTFDCVYLNSARTRCIRSTPPCLFSPLPPFPDFLALKSIISVLRSPCQQRWNLLIVSFPSEIHD